MKFEEVQRSEIENETDFEKLKDMGKAAREAGHVVSLNVKSKKLKTRLLEIYDETHKDAPQGAPAPKKMNEVLNLGEDEPEDTPDESEEDQEEAAAEEIAEEITEAIDEELPEEELPEKEEVKEELYVARQGNFQIWLGEGEPTIEFTKVPRALPSNMNEDTKQRVQAAIERNRIVKYKK